MPLQQLFLVTPATLVAVAEGRLLTLRAEASAEPLGLLVIRAASRVRVERLFEAAAEDWFVHAEVTAVNRVLGLLRVAQSHPPSLARRVHPLGSDLPAKVA